jgi:acyl-CoA thioesterase
MSVDLTTHVHQDASVLGADEWLVGEFEIRHSSGGLAVEHGRIGRADGTVLAESFQTRFTAD